MSDTALATEQDMAAKVVDALGGHGIFGVEFFVKGDAVIFSELSPRPHDTGMVTLISQALTQFDLHARAILGLPIPDIEVAQPGDRKSTRLTPVTNAHLVCRLLLEKKKKQYTIT